MNPDCLQFLVDFSVINHPTEERLSAALTGYLSDQLTKNVYNSHLKSRKVDFISCKICKKEKPKNHSAGTWLAKVKPWAYKSCVLPNVLFTQPQEKKEGWCKFYFIFLMPTELLLGLSAYMMSPLLPVTYLFSSFLIGQRNLENGELERRETPWTLLHHSGIFPFAGQNYYTTGMSLQLCVVMVMCVQQGVPLLSPR